VLNYSVFFYEIKQNANKACKMARDAFDEAISDLDDIDDDFYKDATLIMQLLRDNLTLWTEEVEAEAAAENN
jgi:14-3-3 protein epsilon